jgi:hypothetical protein
MSTDYYTYKEELELSAVKAIEKLESGFKVVKPKDPQEKMWSIKYQGNSLAIFLSDDFKTIELLTRYGSNYCGEILDFISAYSGITLYDEYEYSALIDEERENTLLVVHFSDSEKNCGLDYAKNLGKTGISIDASSLIENMTEFFHIIEYYCVFNLWFPVSDRIGDGAALTAMFEQFCEYDIDLFRLYQGDQRII